MKITIHNQHTVDAARELLARLEDPTARREPHETIGRLRQALASILALIDAEDDR